MNCPILAIRRCCSAALNNRAPAPICVGGVYRPRLELGGPLSRCPAPGLECRPPSPRPTVSSPGLQAGCARVEGGGWVVGWGFEPHSRATLGFLFGCGPRAAAAVSRSGFEGAAVGKRPMEAAAVCPGGLWGRPGLSGSRAACIPRLAKLPRQPGPAGACLRAPSQPVPRGPRVGGCPVHQWKRLSEQKIAFP